LQLNDSTKKELSEKLSGKPVATKYTIDGEVLVRRYFEREGKPVVDIADPLEVVELKPLPNDFKDRHKTAMWIIYDAIKQIHKMPKRDVPLTRPEILGEEGGVKKKDLRYLIKSGLVQERLIGLVEKKGSKPVFSKPVVYFTPQGRAYVRKHFDKDYGVTHDTGKEKRSDKEAGRDSEPLQH